MISLLEKNITITVDESSSNVSLVDYQLSPPITISQTLNIPDSLKIIKTEIDNYIYALSQQNLLYLIDKTNYQNIHTLNLNQHNNNNLAQCMSMVIISSDNQILLDCNLKNSTQVFIIVAVQNQVLSYVTTQASLQTFQNDCPGERRFEIANEYLFKYCPCDSGVDKATFAQIFTYKDQSLTYLSDVNQDSLNLPSPLCIYNFTGTSQFSNLRQIVLVDGNFGVMSFSINGKPPNVEFDLGNPIFLPSMDLKFLGRKTFNNSQYELKYSTNFLIQMKNNFVYEVSATSDGYSISHEYLLKNNKNITGAAITQDFVVFMLRKDDTTSVLKIIQQQTSLLFYSINIASNILLRGSDFELNDVYAINTQTSSTQITKITFSNNLLKLTCCHQEPSDLSLQNLNLSICDLNNSRCFYANLAFYVFPTDYHTPILVPQYNLTQKAFANSQELKIPLQDLVASPVPSILTISSNPSEPINLYLNQSLLFHDRINDSSLHSEIIIHDLYQNSSFLDMYWLQEGKTLDIVAQLTLNYQSNIKLIRCDIEDQTQIKSCSIIQTFQDLNFTINQVVYLNSKLYISLEGSAFIYAFYGDKFEYYLQAKDSSTTCNIISANTQNSGDVLCFSTNQISIFNFNFKSKSSSFLGLFFNLPNGTIRKINDYFLDNQFLLITNETHVIALETSNEHTFTQVFTFQVCSSSSSACPFEVYLQGSPSKKRMIILDVLNNLITEYDLSNPLQILFLRNYPLYGAKLSIDYSQKFIPKMLTDFLPVIVDNCCLQDPTHQSLFLYNPQQETNQLLFAISQDIIASNNYYYFSGDQFASFASIDPNNLNIQNFYGSPQVGFNISLDSRMLEEAFTFEVTLDYASFPKSTPLTPVQKEFSIICDFSNFYISNSSGENITIDFSNQDSYHIRPPFLGPLADFTLQCHNNNSNSSSCPYTLRPFNQRYYFFVNYYQTIMKYGYPIKLQMIDNYLVHLSQKTLNLIKIGLGSEVTKTTDITQYGQCFDLIIEDSTTIYILCQSCYQSFSLLIKEYLPNSEDPPIVELEIPLQFQDVDKAKIDDEFIFLLGNSTQTSSISDISIYQLINQKTQISHIADFSSLFPAFTSFTIQEFDIQLIHSTIVSNGMSSLYAIFLIYSENLYYTEIILTTFDNGTMTAEPNQLLPIPIQTLFTSAYESGSLQYISIDSFEFDQIPSMDFTNYTFSVLLGTSFNIYSVNIT